MEHKASDDINKKRISPYKLLSCSQTSSPETQYSNHRENNDAEKDGSNLNGVKNALLTTRMRFHLQ